jgi:hypothetical protein
MPSETIFLDYSPGINDLYQKLRVLAQRMRIEAETNQSGDRLMKNQLKLFAALTATALSVGCASTKIDELEPGTIAVVAAGHPPQSNFNSYANGRGANAAAEGLKTGLKGAAAGGFAPIVVGAHGGPLGLLLGLIVAPIGAVVGGVVGGTVGLIGGAVNGMPSDQVQAIHRAVDGVRVDAAIQQTMAQRIAALSSESGHRLIYVPGVGPASPRQTPDYGVLKAGEFDSVMELTVVSIGFEATKGEPPSAAFAMTLRARVVPLRGEGKPWTKEWTHRGTHRSGPQWQADDGALFQEELDASYRSLAQSVSGAMLVPSRAPVATAR